MSAIDSLLTHPNYISSEFRLPKPTSSKKKWYVTIICDQCSSKVEKIFQKNIWNYTCNPCGKGKLSTQEFIIKLKNIFIGDYDFSQVSYINNKRDVIIGCPEHGNWAVRPVDAYKTKGCPKCAYAKASKQSEYSISDWNNLIRNPEVTLIRKLSTSDGIFNCNLHGEYSASIHSTVTKLSAGCSVCNILNHQSQSIRKELIGTTSKLYYIHFPSINMYKLGITANILTRFSGHSDWELVWSIEMDYQEAIALEHAIHTAFSQYRYCAPQKIIKDGSYELYVSNVFPTIHQLEKELYAKGIQLHTHTQ